MPWKVYKENNKYCVHKLNPDDTQGEKVACHDTPKQANDQLKALYANIEQEVPQDNLFQGTGTSFSMFSFTDLAIELEHLSKIDGMAAGVFTTMTGQKVSFTKKDMPAYATNTQKVLESTKDSKGNIVGLPIDINNHDHKGGAGWIVGVELDEQRNIIRFLVNWTKVGIEAIKNNLTRFFSPSINAENKTILGGSLTNWPATRSQQGEILLHPVELSLSIKELHMSDEKDNNNVILEALKNLPLRIAELMSNREDDDSDADGGEVTETELTVERRAELERQYLEELAKKNFTVDELLQTPEALEKLGMQAHEIAQKAIKAEARKLHAVNFAAEICGGTQERPFGLPIKATEIVSLLLSLPEAQAKAVEELLRATHLTAIDFAQHGFDSNGYPMKPKLPEPIHGIAVNWIASGKSIEEFMKVNADELGAPEQYDLSEFVVKEK